MWQPANRLASGVVVLILTTACGGASPTPVATSVPAESPAATAKPTTAASPSATPYVPTSPFEGVWATPPVSIAEMKAALEAEGLDPSAVEREVAPPGSFTDYVQFELGIGGGEFYEVQINDGLGGSYWEGQYSLTDTGQFATVSGDVLCNVTMNLRLEEDSLVVDDVQEPCTPNDLTVLTAFNKSAPFHLVEPALGYADYVAQSPSPDPGLWSPQASPNHSTSGERYVPRELGSVAGAPLGYTEYLPPDYGADGASPLLVFLHGSGESGRGSDLALQTLLQTAIPQLIHGNNWPDERPFVVLSPQHTQVDGAPCVTPTEIADFLAFALDHYDVDPARVYLTGLSCGGIGIWNYLAKYGGDALAAAVPIAGYGYAAVDEQGCALGDLPIWAFHGNEDDPRGDAYPINFLRNCTDPPAVDARLTVYPNEGHHIWNETYNLSAGFDIYSWMLSHTR